MCYCIDTDGDGDGQSEKLAEWLEAKLYSIINHFRGNTSPEGAESVAEGAESVAGGGKESKDADGDTKTTELGDSGIDTKDESVVGDVTDDFPKPVSAVCIISCFWTWFGTVLGL